MSMRTPATFIHSYFHGFAWHQASEFAILIFITLAIPIHWRLGIYGLMLLCVNTIIRIIATHKIGNPALHRPQYICLGLMILLFLVFAVSATYSNQPSLAASTLVTMLTILVPPLLFLIVDTRYLQRRHFNLLTYLLATVLTLRFLAMLIRSAFHSIDSSIYTSLTTIFPTLLTQLCSWITDGVPFEPLRNALATIPIRATAHLFNNTPFEYLEEYHFATLHHNYLSLYTLTAIALIYIQLVRHWKSPRWHTARWLVLGDIGLLSTYVLLSASRSGMVIMVLLYSVCLAHLAIKRKQWHIAGLTLLSLVVVIAVSYWAFPEKYERLTYTAERMLEGEEGDIRQTMWQSALDAAKQRPLFGYGCDGYWDELIKQYQLNKCFDASANQYSTHNQYLETLLATGMAGLAVLLAMILVPAILAFNKSTRNLPLLLFTLVYASSFCFEATLERQMGLLFIGFWYCILILYPTIIKHHTDTELVPKPHTSIL